MTAERAAPPPLSATGRVLLAGFVVLHLLLAVTTAPGPGWRSGAALAVTCAAAAAVVLRRPGRPIPAPLLAAACAVATAPVVLALPPDARPGAAAWPIGAWTFIALALAVHGRPGTAWLLLGTAAATALAWSVIATGGPMPGLALLVRPAGILAIGCLFAVALGRTSRRAAALQAAERERTLERAPARAAEQERRTAAGAVLALAEGPLARVASGPVAAADRPALLVLEGRLRDGIMARPLLSEDLNAAAAAVRGRGDDVVLLVDAELAAVEPARRAEAARFLAARLRASEGAFTGRVTVHDGLLRVSAHSAAGSAVRELPLR